MKTQPHFTPMLPAEKVWFTTTEAATIIGRTPQYVRNCFDVGRLPGHRLTTSQSNGEPRWSYQFHRDAILLYLLETANYTPEDFSERLAMIIRGRTAEEIRDIMRRAELPLAS